MIKKCILPISVAILFTVACNSKKNKEEKVLFPVLSFLQSQVAHVDTSLYSIMKLNYIDSTRTDTEYIRRDNFRQLARDFLEIPDLTASKFRKRFREEKRFDETLGRVVISYLPENPEKEQLQRQEILISPDPTGDRVNSIIIDFISNTRDSSVEKKMLWRVDRSFQVTTIKQKPGMPETVTITKVIWNEPADQ